MRTEFLTEYESTVKEIKDRCKQEDGCYDQMVKAEYSREARLAEIERQRATAKIVGLATAAASLTAPVSSAEKLEALQRLYNYEVIDEEEYREKRKLISDQQAAQEVETPQAQAQGASQQGAAGLAGATAATVGATSSAKSEPAVPARLRVAILPFATSSGTAIGYAEIVEVSHDYVHGQPDLQLVYSLAEQIPADLALMYFYRKRVAGWYASELYVFDVYLIDVRRRQVHHRSGDERSLKKMTESVFENIPAASSISSAEPPSTVSRSVTALNK
jgi:hypothetical protein